MNRDKLPLLDNDGVVRGSYADGNGKKIGHDQTTNGIATDPQNAVFSLHHKQWIEKRRFLTEGEGARSMQDENSHILSPLSLSLLCLCLCLSLSEASPPENYASPWFFLLEQSEKTL